MMRCLPKPLPSPRTQEEARKQVSTAFWFRWQHLWSPQDELMDRRLPTGLNHPGPLRKTPLNSLWRQLKTNYPLLLVMSPGIPIELTADESRTLIDLVGLWAPADQRFMAQRRTLEIIDAGNKLGRWSIPIVSLPAPLPAPPKPLLNAEIFEYMVKHDALFSHVANHLAPIMENDDLFWGQVLLTSMLFGGILERLWLWVLPDALIEASDDLHWVELRVKHVSRNTADEELIYRRLHGLDPLTRWAVMQRRKSRFPAAPSGKSTTSNAMRLMRRYATHIGCETLLPDTWTQLVQLCQQRMTLYVPPHLVGQAIGYYRSASVPAKVMRRMTQPLGAILTGKILPQDFAPARTPSSSEYSQALTEDDAPTEKPSVFHEELKILSDVGRILRHRDGMLLIEAKYALHQLAQTPQASLPSVQRMIHWVSDWLWKDGGHARSSIRGRTSYALFNSIAERLVGQLADEDPALLDSVDDYIEIYQTALEDTETHGTRKRMALALESFHRYLVSQHGAPSLEGSDIFQSRRRFPLAVDANLVTYAEYRAAMDWLGRELRSDPVQSRQARLMLTLGFYTGLRRSELIGLRVLDVERAPGWDLVVSPNTSRLLKSSSAHRVLPLRHLLPKACIDSLDDWLEHHGGLSSHENPWLFFPDLAASPGKNEHKLVQRLGNRVLGKVTESLQRVTGDLTLRYHHLRHTFATRMMILCYQHDRPGGHSFFSGYPEMLGLDDPVSTRRGLLGDTPTSRRALWLISRLLGHVDPRTSMGHYIHATDVLLQHAMLACIPHITPQGLQRMTGLSESRLRAITRPETLQRTPVDLLEHLMRTRRKELQEEAEAPPHALALPPELWDQAQLLTEAINAVDQPDNAKHPVTAFPWKQSDLTEWAERVRTLPESLRKPPRGSQPGLLDPPSTQQARRLAKAALIYIDKLKAFERNKLLQSFLEGMQPGDHRTLRITSVPDLKRMLRMFTAIGFEQAVELTHIPTRGHQRAAPGRQLEHWQANCNLEIHAAADKAASSMAGQMGELQARFKNDRPIAVALHGLYWAIVVGVVLSG